MKFKNIYTFLLLSILFMGLGCTSNVHSENKTGSFTRVISTFDTTLKNGVLLDSIACIGQSNVTFALYLPSYYNPKNKYPCIFFFDAHANGFLPLKKYRDLAERYGFVFVGSNTSKNGISWDVNNETIKILRNDVQNRINIDTQRIFTSGFSGGSRVASSVAIFDGGIAGVIGCALGFPEADNIYRNKFDYCGLVGIYDFNLSDMEILDNTLQQNGYSHQLITFTGKHSWCPKESFEAAMLWIQVNEMKRNTTLKNDTLIQSLLMDYQKGLALAFKNKDLYAQAKCLQALTTVLNGLIDVKQYIDQLNILIGKPNLKIAMSHHDQIQQAEMNRKQELAQQFSVKSEKEWVNVISLMNHTFHTSSDQEVVRMNKRLLNFLGFLGYINANHAIITRDYKNAATYLKIFKLADPENPDCEYLRALYELQTENAAQAVEALQNAAQLGYSDYTQLITNPIFNVLKEDIAFKSVLNKVQKNLLK